VYPSIYLDCAGEVRVFDFTLGDRHHRDDFDVGSFCEL
jgi:hypothetical protein